MPAGLGAADTTLVVYDGVGAGLTLYSQAYVDIESETLLVTRVVGNALTVVRAQQGTSAASHANGTAVSVVMPLLSRPVALASGTILSLGSDPSNTFQLDGAASSEPGVYIQFLVTVTTDGVPEDSIIAGYAADRIVTLRDDLSTPATTSSTYVVYSLVNPVAGTGRASFTGPSGVLAVPITSIYSFQPNVTYAFAVRVKNPDVAQSPAVYISANGSSVFEPNEMVAGGCCTPLSLFPTLAETALNADLDDNATEAVFVDATSAGIVKDRFVIIGDEIMKVIALTGNTATLLRGEEWTISSGTILISSDTPQTVFTLPQQASVQLDAYTGWTIHLRTQSAALEARTVVSYVNRVVTIDRPLSSQAPAPHATEPAPT